MQLSLSFETPSRGGASRWMLREEGLPHILAEIMPGPQATELALLFSVAPDLRRTLALLYRATHRSIDPTLTMQILELIHQAGPPELVP